MAEKDPLVRLAFEVMELAEDVENEGFDEESLDIDGALNEFLDLQAIDQ